ncbi:membrane protein with HlyD domain [gamma proteobacterium NOR5-3]|nr:membrane protein with HlyD domain [gamma proteobacterium NOR5-3]
MLPALREELSLYSAAPSADGSPAWSLYDPVRNLFFRIDWLSFEILRRWAVGDPVRIADDVSHATTIEAEVEDVEAVVGFLQQNQLLLPQGKESTERMCGVAEAAQQRWWHWLMHRYLFFRLPLWRPDAWLERNVDRVAVFYTRWFFLATLAALIASVILLGREWTSFRSTLVDVFTPQAVVLFAVTLVFVKFLHELGHAFTAKRFACRVPTMGVAFLVLFPLAYTDVNDVWRLPIRRQRLLVGAAGILVELGLAIWATLAWFLIPDGAVRNALFLIGTTTWISTLLVNVSPFLRFDGYFLLMDTLEIPNLHSRSFALANWSLRKLLFASDERSPESFSLQKTRALVAFALLTWMYRFLVFTGIAWLVYQLFPKPLGPLLASFELYWFLLMPALRGMQSWPQAAREGWTRRGGKRWFGFVAVVLLLVFLPWDAKVGGSGLLKPAAMVRISSPANARVEALLPDGDSVVAGQLVSRLAVPVLESERVRASTREALARWRAEVAGLNASLTEQRSVFAADRDRSVAELSGLDAQLETFRLDADMDGSFLRADIDRTLGSWIRRGELLGYLIDPSRWIVEAYIAEAELERLSAGQNGVFYPETAGSSPLAVTVLGIEFDAVNALSHRMLATTHGGALLARRVGESVVPERGIYRVQLAVDRAPQSLRQSPRQLRGSVVIRGEKRSLVSRVWQKAAALFVREAGL